jgi:hypothetical protein
LRVRGPRQQALALGQLLASGAISAGVLALLVSHRTNWLNPATAAFLLLFVQWQTLSLTVSKCGMEVAVFATVSREPDLAYGFRRVLILPTLPLAICCGIAAAFVFGLVASVALVVSVLMDTYAVLGISEFNGRGNHAAAAMANILNYPLFFAVLGGAALVTEPGELIVLMAFVLSSAARAVWVRSRRTESPATRPAVPAAGAPIALQQAGNYVLFRGDQLVLALPFVSRLSPDAAVFLPAYLFLAKLPELAAGVLNAVGLVVFPRLVRSGAKRLAAFTAVVDIGILLGAFFYVKLWSGPVFPTALLVPFLVHAALVLPVNALTYRMMSEGFVGGLLRNLGAALVPGIALFLLVLTSARLPLLAWIVPVQLATFIACGCILPDGKKQLLYAESSPVAPSA